MKRIGCILLLVFALLAPGWRHRSLAVTRLISTKHLFLSVSEAPWRCRYVAHSSIMRGVGVSRVLRTIVQLCFTFRQPEPCSRWFVYGRFHRLYERLINRTDGAAGNGFIDSPNNLGGQKVWLFSGYNDGLVRRGAMDAVAKYYGHYVNPGNVFYQTDNHAPHALVTNDNFGGPCLGYNHNWVNNCDYDAAGLLLKHIYGNLISPSGTLSSSPQPFDQTEFVETSLVGQVGLADTGWVYVPSACNTDTCRVHVVFHGCLQYAGTVGDAVYNHGGYNKWADKNKIIVLYPQTEPVAITPLLSSKGCWDWWGLKDTLLGTARSHVRPVTKSRQSGR